MKKVAFAAAVVLAAGSALGQRSAGVLSFTGPDGSRQAINVPASTPAAVSLPDALANQRAQLWPAVQASARSHGLDPTLVDLVIRMESGYNPRAVSSKGARGVMQLMPGTANLYGVRNSFDPVQNIHGGVRYLSDLVQRFHSDLSLALAAYNAGPEAVERHGGVPPYHETRTYVRNILSAYQSSAPSARLSGGFGRRTAPPRPVELVGASEKRLISNSRRSGEATGFHLLSLR